MEKVSSNSEESTDMDNFAAECKDFPEIMEALELLKESAYTKEELQTYERNSAIVNSTKAMMKDSFNDGKVEGKIEIARKLKEKGLEIEFIMDATGLEKKDIEKL